MFKINLMMFNRNNNYFGMKNCRNSAVDDILFKGVSFAFVNKAQRNDLFDKIFT